ncbi:MAG: thioredoxin domain-containing protein [Steroidobacteraceae bacterium]
MSTANGSGHPNRLAGETSPYLRQHAHNPVDWYPWGPQALELARQSGKPILLSIGYAACHWCHVMAHESFENEAIAAVMNRDFVNIKVDREERPDLDRLYQIAQQMLTGRGGGWPLTLFLLPEDQRPFFAGTYFPPVPRHGMPGFGSVLEQIAAYHREHGEELRRPADAVVRALADLNPAATDVAPDAGPLQQCRALLERSFDGQFGGFGNAPKFPHPRTLTRLLRDWYASAAATAPDLQALYMSTLTLTRMAEGGLFDQVGGGFCRYSVDERWAIPHFEKMLYDNAELLPAYAEAHIATGEPLFRSVAERTADWLIGEMRAPEGGFYSSLDADSEGHEGKFYVWDEAELRALLAPAEYEAWALRHGLDEDEPNFEGQWHFTVQRSLAEVAQLLKREEYQLEAQLDVTRSKLLAARTQRVRPGLDDKRLTSWNALAIRGLAIAARCLNRSDYAAAAEQALTWLRAHHWHAGRLLATSAGGEARLAAYLDDYVFLADAALELVSVRFDAGLLHFAGELMDAVLTHFTDRDAGGFFFTADDHEQLIARPKSFGDDALPAGNAVALDVLLRLGSLLGDARYLDAAEHTLRAAWDALQRYPHGHTTLLNALESYLQQPQIVVLRGPTEIIENWRSQLGRVYAPNRWVLAVPEDALELPEALAVKTSSPQGVAYLCRGTECLPALRSLEELAGALKG